MRTLELLKCLSDLTRARIVHLLSWRGPELCVCDIVSTLMLPQSTVSRQLMTLRYLGLVQDRRVGIWMHYSIVAPEKTGHRLALELVKNGFCDEPLFSEDLKRFDELRQRGEIAVCEAKKSNGVSRSCDAPSSNGECQ